MRVDILTHDIDMKLRAVEFVMSQEKSKTVEIELAKNLKKDFDSKFHPTWQCVVGKPTL